MTLIISASNPSQQDDNTQLVPLQLPQEHLSDYVRSIWSIHNFNMPLEQNNTLELRWELKKTPRSDLTLTVIAYAPEDGAEVCKSSVPANARGFVVVPSISLAQGTSQTVAHSVRLPSIPLAQVCLYAVLNRKQHFTAIIISDSANKESGPIYKVNSFCGARQCDLQGENAEGITGCDPVSHTCQCVAGFIGRHCYLYRDGSPLHSLIQSKGCRVHSIDHYSSIAENTCKCIHKWQGTTCNTCPLAQGCTGASCTPCQYGLPDIDCIRCVCDPYYGGPECRCRTSYFTINTSRSIRHAGSNVSTIDRLEFITQVRLALALDLNIAIQHILIQKVRSTSIFIEISSNCQDSWTPPARDVSDHEYYYNHPKLQDIFETPSSPSSLEDWIVKKSPSGQSSIDNEQYEPSLTDLQSLSTLSPQILALYQQYQSWSMDDTNQDASFYAQQSDAQMYLSVAAEIKSVFDSSQQNAVQYNIFNVQALRDANIFQSNRAITPITPLYFANCSGSGCSILGPDPFSTGGGNTMLVLIIVIVIVVLLIVASAASILYCRKRKLCCYKAIEERNNRRKRSRSTTATGKRSASTTDGDSHSGSESGSAHHSGSGSGSAAHRPAKGSSGSSTGDGRNSTPNHSGSETLGSPSPKKGSSGSGVSLGVSGGKSGGRRNTPAPRGSSANLSAQSEVEFGAMGKKKGPVSPPSRLSVLAGSTGQLNIPDDNDGRPLPPGWRTARDNTGKTYYVNTLTLTSSWVHPLENCSDSDDDDDEEVINIVEEE